MLNFIQKNTDRRTLLIHLISLKIKQNLQIYMQNQPKKGFSSKRQNAADTLMPTLAQTRMQYCKSSTTITWYKYTNTWLICEF